MPLFKRITLEILSLNSDIVANASGPISATKTVMNLIINGVTKSKSDDKITGAEVHIKESILFNLVFTKRNIKSAARISKAIIT